METIKLEKEFVKRFENLYNMANKLHEIKDELDFQRDSLWRDIQKTHGRSNYSYNDKNQELISMTDEEAESKDDEKNPLKQLFKKIIK